MRLSIRAYRTAIVERRLRGIGDNAMNAQEAFSEIADYMFGAIEKVFDAEGRRAGPGWRKLTVDWLYRKVMAGGDSRILHDTHALRDSMTIRGDENQILEITDHNLRLGSTLPYGERHHYGGGDMPARPFADRFTQRDVKNMKRILVRHVLAQRSARKASRLRAS